MSRYDQAGIKNSSRKLLEVDFDLIRIEIRQRVKMKVAASLLTRE